MSLGCVAQCASFGWKYPVSRRCIRGAAGFELLPERRLMAGWRPIWSISARNSSVMRMFSLRSSVLSESMRIPRSHNQQIFRFGGDYSVPGLNTHLFYFFKYFRITCRRHKNP
ncbi:hypothetical protein CENSYa_0607 [Cenarchaeum symbiosum A]|uniref:Uncharacterized protein n=1 Tax=Cenarchaeum symbiosum (strain A) TaxID=414004 RepID=A0RV73_CENSY|nr:hypothetical protein CENSYa_0607 [Cenarchaeum symbiosum A]